MKKIISNTGIIKMLNIISNDELEYNDFSDILIRISERERLHLQNKQCENLMETEIMFVEVEFDFGSNKSILNGVKSGIEVVNNIIPIIKTNDNESIIVAPLSDLLLLKSFLPENLRLVDLRYDLFLKNYDVKKDTFKDSIINENITPEQMEYEINQVLNKS